MRKKLIKYLSVIVFVLMIILTPRCEDRFWDNPNDINTGLTATDWACSNLKSEIIDEYTSSLSWTNNTRYIVKIQVERNCGIGFDTIAVLNSNVDSYIDHNLIYGNTYTYRLKAFTKNNESVYTNESRPIKMVIPAPSNLSATALDTQNIQLSWIDTCTFESGFNIERKVGNGSYEQM